MKNACIEGLTIFYPLQGIVSGSGTTDPQIVEYPACIIMGDLEEYQDESTVNSDNSVRNMLLVNPYIGIYCRTYIEVEIGSPPGPTSPPTEQGIGRVYLSNIHGCPLQNGIIVDGLWDVTYIERINFSPYFLYEDYSDANQERKDWNTYVLRNCTAIHIKFAVWSILNDVFALTAHRGLVLDHNNQTAEGFDGAVDIMGTNIQFDQCDVCIEVVAGEAYLTNVRLTGGLNYKVRDYYANDYNLCSEKKAILTSGDPASVLTIINGSITCFDEPLSSPPPNPQCVVWEKAGILNIQNVLFVDNNIVEISCGVYMSDGRLTLSNCRFQNNNSGFTKAFEITGNVESAIISGNDYQGIDPGINYAQDRNFTVDGALLLHQTVGEIGLSLEGNAQGNTPFLTWKGQPEETSPPTAETAADSYSIRYSNSDLKLSMGYGNNDIGYTSQITIDQPTGNLGIGTTTPSEKLTVQDTNTSLRIGDGIGNAGNPEPQIKSPGALLIGVDSEVNGSEFIRLTYEDGRNWLQSFEADTTVSPPAPKAAALTLAAGTSRGIEIDTSGNVGIGTATPTQALDVEGRITVHPTGTTPDNNYNGNLVITKPASSGQYLNFVRYGNFVWSMGMVYGTNKFAIAPGDSTDADFPTAATSLVIDGAGAVGIGTDTPTSKLTLAGGDFLVDNGGSNRYLVHTQKTYNYGLYFDYSAESLAVVTHSTPRLTVDDGGNVGIGTTSPGSGLHIGVDAGGTDKGYITLEQLTTTPSAPGTGKSIIYMRNGYLCTRVGTGNEVILA
ncbi:MAG: hypothetical protein JW863_21000 [Chitinispirillaceae bacterium]|nr:hypothetical protein [Chitinispirillaceae bacterium]